MASTDFTVPDGRYDAVGPDVFFSLPPLLLAGLGLLIVLAAILGWIAGRGGGPSSDTDAPAIWKAVNEAIQAALKAHSDVVEGLARELVSVVERRLGKTLALAHGLEPLAALRSALREDDGHADHDHSHDSHGGHAATDPHADHAHAAANEPNPAPTVHIGRVGKVVINTRDAGRDNGHRAPAQPTPAQRREAVRRAVHALNDHWRHKDARLREMNAAHAELSARRGGGDWRFS